MTIAQWCLKYLEDLGMFPEQAKAVMAPLLSGTREVPGMLEFQNRWEDFTEGYPESFLRVLMLYVDQAATEWIDANVPKAWYRPIFAHEESLNDY